MAGFDFEATYGELLKEAKKRGKDLMLYARHEGLEGYSVVLGKDERARQVLAFRDGLEDCMTTALERIKAPDEVKPMGNR